MKKKFLIIFAGLFLVSALFGVQSDQALKKQKLVITGYVVSKGNVPFVYPAIRAEDGTEYMIVCKEKQKQKLLNAQGTLIKFTGTLNESGLFVLKKWKVVK